MKKLIIITLAPRVLCAGVLSVSVLCASASASIMLTSDTLSTPLSMDADSLSAETMTLSIFSDDAPNDKMLGWMVLLRIVPESGASGNVGFQSAQSPTSNYVFGTATSFFGTTISTTNSGNDTLEGYGLNFSSSVGQPVAIPGVPGFNLLSFDFVASQGASGTFGVYTDPEFSLWSDDAAVEYQFGDTTDPIRVGTITVNPVVGVIPEPASLVVWLGLGVCFSCYVRNRRRR